MVKQYIDTPPRPKQSPKDGSIGKPHSLGIVCSRCGEAWGECKHTEWEDHNSTGVWFGIGFVVGALIASLLSMYLG